MADRAIARGEPDYPLRLADLADAPPVVYVRGAPAWPAPAAAIVGSRAATPYGRTRARVLAGDLAALGWIVVSGLARGIDAAAHEAALAAGGRTVAVLPGGLDAITPPHHRPLAERIVARGALLAEREAGSPIRPGMFVSRNRLIAALAQVTVVVEAAEGSGALTTASFARRLGRPVLAVPGDVDRPTSRGCHRLLRAGAHVCEDAADVVRAAGALAPRRAPAPARRRAPAPAPDAAAPAEARLLAALAAEPRSLEAIAGLAGLDAGAAVAGLLQLEWSGLAIARPGQRWIAAGSRA